MPQSTDTLLNNVPNLQNQNCLAKAIYDNIAESPDELAFRKGEILIVLEQNTAGIQGWWLCSLRGRQGICPGNRLRLIAGVYADTGQLHVDNTNFTSSSPTPPPTCQYQNTLSTDIMSLQRQGKRLSWHVQSNKVITPKKINDVFIYDNPSPIQNNNTRYNTPSPIQQNYNNIRYDVPTNRCDSPRFYHNNQSPSSLTRGDTPLSDMSQESYDVPPRAVPICYDTPRSWRSSPNPPQTPPNRRDSIGSSYDIPRPLQQQPLTPSSSASSLTTADSLSSSNRSSLANMPDYDVPKPSPRTVIQPSGSVYDVPASNPVPKELPLEINSALDTLERLQAEATVTIGQLLGFVTPQWRTRDKLESKLMDIKLAVVRLRTSLHDLAEFGEGALGNAARAPDKGLAIKLRPLVKALRDADTIIQRAANSLEIQDWSIDSLSRHTDHEEGNCKPPDALDQIVSCARALTEDVRQTASFIQGNSTLLFKKSTLTSPQAENEDWLEDYDYVNLDSRDTVAKKHAEIRNALPTELKKSYDQLVHNAETIIDNPNDANDKQLLIFYASQAITYSNHLTHAIDAFLQTVEHNQAPKVFLAHGKFVVLSAHRLVNIGDTVHRNLNKNDVRQQILSYANALSEALAATVAKTKRAALQFPNVTAVQEMVDSVVDVSHAARDLKLALVQATQ